MVVAVAIGGVVSLPIAWALAIHEERKPRDDRFPHRNIRITCATQELKSRYTWWDRAQVSVGYVSWPTGSSMQAHPDANIRIKAQRNDALGTSVCTWFDDVPSEVEVEAQYAGVPFRVFRGFRVRTGNPIATHERWRLDTTIAKPTTGIGSITVPYQPLVLGIAGNAIAYGAVFIVPVVAWRAARRRRWERSGRCHACGYDTRGFPTCPECGVPVPTGAGSAQQPQAAERASATDV